MKKQLVLVLTALVFSVTLCEAQKAKQPAKPKEETVYTTADVMPEFVGNVQEFLAKNVNYPEAALKQKVEGRVVIKFVIDEKGRITDAIVERNVNPALDAEALRAVKKMPNWKPATNNGKPVKVYYRVPVKFVLA